jgi:hypothetical protein
MLYGLSEEQYPLAQWLHFVQQPWRRLIHETNNTGFNHILSLTRRKQKIPNSDKAKQVQEVQWMMNTMAGTLCSSSSVILHLQNTTTLSIIY